MSAAPEIIHRQWVAAAVMWLRTLGFTAGRDDQLRALCENLIPFPAERAPSSGRPGRHVIHGRYRRGAQQAQPFDVAQDEVSHG
jgi:hypothetical protein